MKSISRPLGVVRAGALAALAGCASVSGPQTAAPPISPANVLVAGPGDATSQAPEKPKCDKAPEIPSSDPTVPVANIPENVTDATVELQKIIDAAAANSTGVRLDPSRTYTVTSELVLKKKLKFFDGGGATIKAALPKGDKEGNVFRFETGASNMKLTNVVIDLKESTEKGADVRGVLGSAISDVEISNLTILNIKLRGIDIVARDGAVARVNILNNRTVTEQMNDPKRRDEPAPEGQQAISVTSGITGVTTGKQDKYGERGKTAAYDRFADDGKIAETNPTSTCVTIAGNNITGGYYGIEFSGVSNSKIKDNFSTQNTRNLSMQNRSDNNEVTGNYFGNSLSASIHLAYGSSGNTISGNKVITTRSHGEGLLQAYQGSQNNKFENNVIEAKEATGVKEPPHPNWMFYVGPASDNNVFQGNILSGKAARAVVAVESIWDRDSTASGDGKTLSKHSYAGRKITDPDDIEVTYAGGQGDLTGVKFVDNVLLPTGTPFYVGAEVSKGVASNTRKERDAKQPEKKLIGNITGLNISGNHLAGTGYSEYPSGLAEHKGSLPGIESASINYESKEIGQHHSTVTDQQGGNGNDRFVFDASGDKATDSGGTDTLYTAIDTTIPAGVENLQMLGSGPLKVTGNDEANAITGNSADNTLSGEGGDDILAGGEGANTLTGGAGNDTFVLDGRADGRADGKADTLTDFASGQDKIKLPAATFGYLGDDAFTTGSATTTTRIYQQDGTLFFDADGSGGLYQPVAIAKLPAGVQVQAGDLIMEKEPAK